MIILKILNIQPILYSLRLTPIIQLSQVILYLKINKIYDVQCKDHICILIHWQTFYHIIM
jgi:hypothetical protein